MAGGLRLKGGMMRYQRMVVVGLMLFGLAGCQCCRLTEHYADAIDCVSDHECCLDPLYHPCYDLTRIGRSDWCACWANRLLCRCRCERCKPVACAAGYEAYEYRTQITPTEDAPAEDAVPPAPEAVPDESQLGPVPPVHPTEDVPSPLESTEEGPVFLPD